MKGRSQKYRQSQTFIVYHELSNKMIKIYSEVIVWVQYVPPLEWFSFQQE